MAFWKAPVGFKAHLPLNTGKNPNWEAALKASLQHYFQHFSFIEFKWPKSPGPYPGLDVLLDTLQHLAPGFYSFHLPKNILSLADDPTQSSLCEAIGLTLNSRSYPLRAVVHWPQKGAYNTLEKALWDLGRQMGTHVTLCLENESLKSGSPSLENHLADIEGALNHPLRPCQFQMCLDIGHLLGHPNPWKTITTSLNRFRNHLSHLHLHGHNGRKDHQPLSNSLFPLDSVVAHIQTHFNPLPIILETAPVSLFPSGYGEALCFF